ncbi:MAG: hypothetical protein HQK49_21185 [Oligoflexia bacterium]|nr:hypothetical protein [Oligoflexia bacterium]
MDQQHANANANSSAKAIIFSDNNFDDILLFSIETTFNFEVLTIKNYDQLVQNISNQYFALIVLFVESGKEILEKINQLWEQQKVENRLQCSALIIIGNYLEDDQGIKKIKEFNFPTLTIPKVIILNINRFIIENFIKDNDYIEAEFSPISLTTLMRFKKLSFPAYIKLKTRFLKVLSEGDQFYSDDLNKYHSKGITHLYLKRKTSKWILGELDNHIDSIMNMTDLKGSIDITVPSSEVPKEIFNEKIVVAFKANPNLNEINSKPTTISAGKPTNEELTIADEFKITKDADVIGNLVGKPFRLRDEQMEEVKENLNAVVKVVMKNPEICKLLKMLKINRDKSSYYVNHIGTLINVCTAIATNMDWKTERTIEKLVYASYFHDAGLSEKPELSQLKNEIEAREKGLAENDLKLYLSHPSKVAALLKEVEGFPEDVHLIVEQHHESPKGDGFPKKISSTRIIPLTSVFILSHSLVDYMIDDPKWNISDFIVMAKKDFPGNSFRKVVQSLEMTKSQIQ